VARPASSQIDRAASILCRSRLSRERFDRFPDGWKPADEAEAYAIQEALHRELSGNNWGRVVGHKIGCTTKVMQAFLGIENPCAGGVFDSTAKHQVGHFQIPAGLRVGVECEIAVVMGRDLAPEDAPFQASDLDAAVQGCMAAIEVVEDRYVNYPALDTPTLIADDFFGAGCVLGSVRKDYSASELSSVTAQMWINGVEVGAGKGTDVLGDPLRALAWLADSLAERGQGLRQGEFVLLGSLVQTHWVQPGDEVLIRNNLLGDAQTLFA
jgi:2-oxo-3-hexenedioate decarboxylase/2-keto-4-pentenoate hydratase